MKTQKHLFEGAWNVVSLEYRIAGEWRLIFEPAPDEWSIDFLPHGVFVDLYHPEGDSDSGRWTFDESTEVISVHPDSGPKGFIKKYVFYEEMPHPYLYLFDDIPHGRHDARYIMDHHAHTRLGLERVFG